MAQTTAASDSYFWGSRGYIKVKLGRHGVFPLGELLQGQGAEQPYPGCGHRKSNAQNVG